ALPAAPSGASTYYDYWGYWHKPPGQSAWQYSKVGASGYYLQKGSQVEGWRFAIGTASPSDPQPRPTNVSYDDYCKDTRSTYRVLLVVDYGTQSGAPKGPVYSCYGFDSAETGFQVLTQQHSERDSSGLICAIDTYPKSGCGEVASSPAPKPAHTTATTKPAASHRAVAPVAAAATTPPPSTSPTGSAPPAHRATAAPTTTTSATGAVSPSPTPTDSSAVVATPFVAPRRHGGVPYGFVAACVFVVAVVGAVFWQRRRRAG
ncbi:MAG: hypothetical protein JO079_00210, partial [Frankiaceae bacterium]|nr:hypothetical protein [Frankiaceae bacterium]